MPNIGGAAVMNVNSVGSLTSTSIFEDNMSTLIDWLPPINISSSVFTASSLSIDTSIKSTLSLLPSSKLSSSLSLSPSSSSSSSSSSLSSSPSYVQTVVDLDDKVQETIDARSARLTTTSCGGSSTYYCSEDQATDSVARGQEKVEEVEQDEGYASGDESTDINNDNDDDDDDIFIESSSVGDSSEIYQQQQQQQIGLTATELIDDSNLLFGFDGDFITMEDQLANISLYNDTIDDSANSTNGTYVILGDSMYPSGYSLIQIIFASIFATVLMIIVVVGNMLVIIAIATEKALKNIQNWFIASLAVADFFLGLVIMPFSLANEIMGYWIFGYWWCDIYSAMDVLLCTASIMNLCLISLDRFWSITQAVDYLKKRTPARAALMIALVWLLSALVCIPPLLGWKRPRQEEEYPKCKLSEDMGYVLYSALGSFYIPSCIMVFVYIRIYYAAKARARRGIRKQPRPRPVPPPESPDIRQTSFTQSTPATESRQTPGINTMENVATIESQAVQIPIVTCDFASDVSTSEADGGNGSLAGEEKDTLKVSLPMVMQKTNLKATLSVNGAEGQSSQIVVPIRCRAPSVGIDIDMVSEFDPSSSDSGVVSRCAVVKPLKLRLCRPIFGRKMIGKVKRDHGGDGGRQNKSDGGTPIETKPPKPRDPEREKRRIARKKEKRATLILGLIMGSFIACWLPFFFLYIIKPLIPSLTIPGQAFVIAFWLGYINSALNPVIYTVFNKDFRRAFRRILYK